MATNPQLTIENDSGAGGYLGGVTGAAGTINNLNFNATPTNLTNSHNGGGTVNAELANGAVVSLQFVATGTFPGLASCVLSGTVTASWSQSSSQLSFDKEPGNQAPRPAALPAARSRSTRSPA